MSKAHSRWTVLGHQPLEKLNDNLWRVEGVLPKMQLTRTMVVARLSDGRLVIHGAIALDEASMAELEAWGTPAILLVPNGWHRLDAPSYKARYPQLQVLCPAGSRKRVEQVIAVDGTYDDFPADDAVSLVTVEGIKGAEGVMRVRSADGTTLVFNDLLFNVPHGRGFFWFVFRVLGSTGGPKVTWLFRRLSVKRKPELRASLERLATEPDLCRLIPGHGQSVEHDASGVLRSVASSL